MSETLVVIPAHADDVELNAGGTVAKWVAGGGKVHVIMMTDNCSGIRTEPKECSAIRHREQEAAAALYGGTVHYRDYSQRHYWDVEGNRRISIDYEHETAIPDFLKGHLPLVIAFQESDHIESLTQQIISLEPSLVLTQTPLDPDPEHHAVASMVWRGLQSHSDELKDVPLRFWAPGSKCQDGLIDPRYDYFEDITDFYEKKLELFGCHKSQISDTRWSMISERAKYFGQKIGVEYAEPFNTATREIRFGK